MLAISPLHLPINWFEQSWAMVMLVPAQLLVCPQFQHPVIPNTYSCSFISWKYYRSILLLCSLLCMYHLVAFVEVPSLILISNIFCIHFISPLCPLPKQCNEIGPARLAFTKTLLNTDFIFFFLVIFSSFFIRRDSITFNTVKVEWACHWFPGLFPLS